MACRLRQNLPKNVESVLLVARTAAYDGENLKVSSLAEADGVETSDVLKSLVHLRTARVLLQAPHCMGMVVQGLADAVSHGFGDGLVHLDLGNFNFGSMSEHWRREAYNRMGRLTKVLGTFTSLSQLSLAGNCIYDSCVQHLGT